MGLVTYKTEIMFSIPPAKVVEALVEAGNLLPKGLLPVIKRAAVLEEATSSEGSRYKTVKHKVEVPDEENFIYCCSFVEGDELANTYEEMSHEVKIALSPEGGSVCKNTSMYYTNGQVDNTEEKIRAWKERAFGMVRTIEALLVGNPHDLDQAYHCRLSRKLRTINASFLLSMEAQHIEFFYLMHRWLEIFYDNETT